jgi:hypothetical protein
MFDFGLNGDGLFKTEKESRAENWFFCFLKGSAAHLYLSASLRAVSLAY